MNNIVTKMGFTITSMLVECPMCPCVGVQTITFACRIPQTRLHPNIVRYYSVYISTDYVVNSPASNSPGDGVVPDFDRNELRLAAPDNTLFLSADSLAKLFKLPLPVIDSDKASLGDGHGVDEDEFVYIEGTRGTGGRFEVSNVGCCLGGFV